MNKLFLLLLITPAVLCRLTTSEIKEAKAKYELENNLYEGLREYMLTGFESKELKASLNAASAPLVFRDLEENPKKSLVCSLCNVVAKLLLNYRHDGADIEELRKTVKLLCVKAQIETENVCNGVVDLNIGIFLYIIDNKKELTPESICSILAQPVGCPNPEEDNWEVEIPAKIESDLSNGYKHKKAKSDEPIHILQLTDIHFDELYKVGGNVDCDEPLCCGSNQGEPASPDVSAGTWGDYRQCDMPWYSVEMLMKQVMKHKIDYIYYTGDIINHRVWATSIQDNIKNIKRLYNKFKETFINIPVFPVLGNHEPNPLNEFSPENVTEYDLSTQWLYNVIAEEWKTWLPESTQLTLKKGGYYTVLVKPGFRIIALNSNVAYTFNWWLMYDQSILRDQLNWLVDTLYKAEKNGEIVHILSHIPTGDLTCINIWSREYSRIIERFSHVIAAQFVGHTHYDEMNLFFKNDNIKEPINVVFNGGSFTTFGYVNPNYIIYEANPKTMTIENYDQWIYNVTEANKNSVDVYPIWYKLYTFKEAYGLKSMELKELANLIENITTNQTLLDQYYRYKMRESDYSIEKGCDQNCHENNICNLVLTSGLNKKICNDLVDIYRDYVSLN